MGRIRHDPINDAEFPAPAEEPQVPAPFRPRERHWLALRAFIETGGSAAAAAEASGIPLQKILALTRRVWFREQLSTNNFVPITAEELGGHIAREAGVKALERITDDNVYLSNSDLVRLGNLGVAMLKNNTQVTVNHTQIGSLQQIDLRGLSPDQLAVLTGEGDVFDLDPLD